MAPLASDPGFGQLVDPRWIAEQVVLDPQGALDDL
jgi:hypothetical protein